MSEANLQSFYDEFLARLEAAGVPVVILGGQAMLRHRIAETTKDADLFVRPDHFSGFLKTLEQMRYDGAAATYRRVISAPLALPWAAGGWGSHFEFPVAGGPRPRIDVLARPPRIDPAALPRSGVAPLYLLAETKKTRRQAKDWGQVATLGHLLLDAGDARGLLLLQDEDELRERLPQFPRTEMLMAQRPNLRLAWEANERLGAALEMERRFWRFFDAARWSIFEDASREYMQALRQPDKEWPPSLAGQHEVLCQTAEDHLPADPLAAIGLATIVNDARKRAVLGYPAEFEDYLPPKPAVLQPWT